jgi:hypothetical protein
MKVVIDVPETVYEAFKEWHKNKVATVEQSIIANGTPYEESSTGHWINEHSIDIGYKTAECSECGKRSRLISHDTGFGYKYEYYPFCHWCGADMRGGKV